MVAQHCECILEATELYTLKCLNFMLCQFYLNEKNSVHRILSNSFSSMCCDDSVGKFHRFANVLNVHIFPNDKSFSHTWNKPDLA